MLKRWKGAGKKHNFVCSILRGGIDTTKVYLAFSELDDGLAITEQATFEGGLTIRYYGKVVEGAQTGLESFSEFFGRNRTTALISGLALGGGSFVLTGGVSGILEAAAIGASALLPAVPLVTDFVGKFIPAEDVQGIFQHNFDEMIKKDEARRKLSRRGKALVRPESMRNMALVQTLLGIVQAGAEERFKSSVIGLLFNDWGRAKEARNFKKVSLDSVVEAEPQTEAARRRLSEEIASYVARNNLVRAEKTKGDLYGSFDAIVVQFLETYPDDALALFNHAVIDVFNAFQISSHTPLETLQS